MKTIGIVLREFVTEVRNTDVPLYGIRRDIISFLRKYDVNVIGIPLISRKNDAEELERVTPIIDMCDGIIFPGGVTCSYLDSDVARYLHEIDKPTFGFCLGMQVMGRAFNGNKLEKIEGASHSSKDKYVHKIKINLNSKLYEILGEEEIEVNSRHNYCIKETGLDIVAYSEDGIVEAIEDKSKKFFIGVQWHPESLPDDENSNKLFDYYISKLWHSNIKFVKAYWQKCVKGGIILVLINKKLWWGQGK